MNNNPGQQPLSEHPFVFLQRNGTDTSVHASMHKPSVHKHKT